MTCAVATEEALGIEYDEQTACDVCRDVCEMHVCDCVKFVVEEVSVCSCEKSIGKRFGNVGVGG